MTDYRTVVDLYANWPADSCWQRASQLDDSVTNILSTLPPSQRSRTLGAGGPSPQHGLINAFLPIAVNPSDELRTRMILETYVHASEGLPEAARELSLTSTINWDATRVTDFVQRLVEEASNRRRAANDPHLFARQHTHPYALVLGEKGIGKTHFQNYLLSRYSALFDEHKILWVRINLIRTFGDQSVPIINDWVRAQIAKILCRYYDSRSQYCTQKRPTLDIDFRLALTQHLEQTPLKSREKSRLHTELTSMLGRFQETGKDSDIQPSWVPRVLADEIFSLARRKGFSFVVVFDGLDLLSLSPAQKDRLRATYHAVTQYLQQETTTPCYHLLFARPESLSFVQASVEDAQASPYKSGETPIYEIAPISARLLFEKRLAFIKAHSEQFDVTPDQIRRFLDLLDTEDSHLRDATGNAITYAQAISQISHLNARSVTQLLTTAATHLVNPRIPNYHLTEMAMIGKRLFPPAPYTYVQNQSELVRTTPADFRVHDTVFLPSIFCFPYPAGANVAHVFAEVGIAAYLLGLRLLQVTSEHFRRCRRAIPVPDLITSLEYLFRYSREVAFLCLEDLIEVELLQLKSSLGLGQFPENASVMPTPKGRAVLSYYFFDATYLGISGFTVPLPESLLPGIVGSTGIVAAKVHQTDKLEGWVETKLQNCFSMGKLIQAANQSQRESARRNLLASEPEKNIWRDEECLGLAATLSSMTHPIYAVGEQIQLQLIETARRVFLSLEPARQDTIILRLNATIRSLQTAE